jgi:hypothetical protein
MGLIKEPKNVDFFVIDNPWSDEEKKDFSELIKKEKLKSKTRIATSLAKRKKHFA